MEEKIIWWDNFDDCPTTEREAVAPPERYTEVRKSTYGGYLEIWEVAPKSSPGPSGNMQVAFSESEWMTASDLGAFIWARRENAAERCNCMLIRMIRWYVPETHYNRLLSHLGLSDLTGG